MLEDNIGFDKIREYVAGECTNALAVRMAEEMTFMTKHDKVVRELQLTEEFRQILLMENAFPMNDFFDLTDELTRLRLPGTVIELQALFDLRSSLSTLTACLRFFNTLTDKYPHLQELASRVDLDPNLLKAANKIVDDKGEIYDNASETLFDIRRQMLRKRGEIDTQISRQLSRAKQEGWAPQDAEPTIRDGRMVIPMLDTHRRKIKGLIHDESATRQTAYLEPSEVVELNNDLRELEFAERHEIQKILARFTDQLRPQLDALTNAYWVLARFDFIRAKARFAITLHAVRPIVDPITKINWLDARHPLLLLSRNGEGVVPFNMELDDEHHILIISGPNAGGKSVCLKAVGLIQYMLQCGMLVPCRETSEFGIFDNIFIDIGDQQSIDNDLSTYTSHLQNMKQLLETAGEGTLFLLDELGGGTEPRSGCAIAEAVLEELYGRHAFGVVTTHFADLKLMADRHPGIVNGAMLFDTEKMKPLYRLAIGHPGSSFAFEIAQNIGFPPEVLKAAAGKVGDTQLNFEHQLQQIELDKQEIARQRTELEVADSFLAEVTEKYQRLTQTLEAKRHDILSAARKEAQQILADANRTVEKTISDIRTAQAERETTLKARQEIENLKLKIEKEAAERSLSPIGPISPTQNAKPKTLNSPITVGSIVAIDGEETYGQVVEIKGKKAVVESNSIRMTIALERLTGTQKKSLPTDKTSQKNNRFQSIYNDINEKRKIFSPTLDLRGQRVDEAMDNLQHFLDDAQLLSEKELRILHGKGYGILKQVIREYLQGNRDVRSFHSESVEFGGDGITVVLLK